MSEQARLIQVFRKDLALLGVLLRVSWSCPVQYSTVQYSMILYMDASNSKKNQETQLLISNLLIISYYSRNIFFQTKFVCSKFMRKSKLVKDGTAENVLYRTVSVL